MFHVTERLLLRPAWPEDAEALLGGIADEAIVRNLASAPWPYLPKHAREFVMRQHDPRYPVFLVTLPTGSGSEVIGCIGIDPCDSADAEIGYWIAPHAWGRGVATEAARALIGWLDARGQAGTLVSGHFADNPASGRVLEKLGFEVTETGPVYCLGRGREIDHVFMKRTGQALV